jgi:hypothetical protein
MSGFGTGSNSNGQFWYGSSTNFPGFLYKKNGGCGGRRSTKFGAGGNITTNTHQNVNNKYKPGTSGVGASSTAVRRAKNRLSTVCHPEKTCGVFYTYLGLYSNSGNPNGYFPFPPPPPKYSVAGRYTLTSNQYYNTIIIFTGDGTFSLNYQTPVDVSYIIVGGGGGGGGGGFFGGGAGGGGGGEVKQGTTTMNLGTYNIFVGLGGDGGTPGFVYGGEIDSSGIAINPVTSCDQSANQICICVGPDPSGTYTDCRKWNSEGFITCGIDATFGYNGGDSYIELNSSVIIESNGGLGGQFGYYDPGGYGGHPGNLDGSGGWGGNLQDCIPTNPGFFTSGAIGTNGGGGGGAGYPIPLQTLYVGGNGTLNHVITFYNNTSTTAFGSGGGGGGISYDGNCGYITIDGSSTLIGTGGFGGKGGSESNYGAGGKATDGPPGCGYYQAGPPFYIDLSGNYLGCGENGTDGEPGYGSGGGGGGGGSSFDYNIGGPGGYGGKGGSGTVILYFNI